MALNDFVRLISDLDRHRITLLLKFALLLLIEQLMAGAEEQAQIA